MPCRSDGYEEQDKFLAEEVKKKERATKDKLTRMACAACSALDEQGVEIEDPELRAWWETHKEHDKTRVQQELDDALAKYNKANAVRLEAEQRLQAIQKEAEKIKKRKK